MSQPLGINKERNFESGFYKQLPENIICFSHLRWDFVFQRPQQLMTRFSKHFTVYFIEEPILDTEGDTFYDQFYRGDVQVMVPHLPKNVDEQTIKIGLKALLDDFVLGKALSKFTFWYYTPMALEFSRKYQPELIIYDCMDELSAFKFAPQSIKDLEKELMKKADVVFTGGQSLFEAKKDLHANIHPFPSSIDKKHFRSARNIRASNPDVKKSEAFVLGFYGVIDERFDIKLIKEIAQARPDWTLQLLGPVVKIDPAQLPKNKNIAYRGQKSYEELPSHLATWDFALIPFLLNDSTRFISPTKTPEYLAAGVPVISTAIRDVVDPYAKNKLVKIASNAEEFIMEVEDQLQIIEKDAWLEKVDEFLAQNSWDNTCSRMLIIMTNAIATNSLSSIAQ